MRFVRAKASSVVQSCNEDPHRERHTMGKTSRYRAIIARPETETALQVTVRARSLTVACKRLEDEYGQSAVYSLQREDDAPQLSGDSGVRNRYRGPA